MAKYIKVEDAIEAAINGCASWDGGYFPSMDDPIKEEFDAVADKCIDLVRCGECKYYIPWDDATYGNCKVGSGARMKDFYCNLGERKDGERDV